MTETARTITPEEIKNLPGVRQNQILGKLDALGSLVVAGFEALAKNNDTLAENDGKLLAALNHSIDSNIQGSLEKRPMEQASSFAALGVGLSFVRGDIGMLSGKLDGIRDGLCDEIAGLRKTLDELIIPMLGQSPSQKQLAELNERVTLIFDVIGRRDLAKPPRKHAAKPRQKGKGRK